MCALKSVVCMMAFVTRCLPEVVRSQSLQSSIRRSNASIEQEDWTLRRLASKCASDGLYVLCQTKYSTHAQRAEPSGFFGFKPPAGRHCTQCMMHANPIIMSIGLACIIIIIGQSYRPI